MTTTDTQPHYSAHLLHFAAVHWLELESRRDDVRREFELLDHERGEVCLCATKWAVAGESSRRGDNDPGDRIPSTLMLDFRLAYAQLPIAWEGRTRVYLMTVAGPYTEMQIAAMRRSNEFTLRHRRRIATEPFDWSAFPRPQDRLPERMTPWRYMAHVLNGERTELRKAA